MHPAEDEERQLGGGRACMGVCLWDPSPGQRRETCDAKRMADGHRFCTPANWSGVAAGGLEKTTGDKWRITRFRLGWARVVFLLEINIANYKGLFGKL